MILEVGQTVPQFSLLNHLGETVSSDGLKGHKTVLYFYPAAGTPSCTTQACEFRDNLAELERSGYRVIGISPDKPAKLAKFREKEGLGFDLLSDPENHTQISFGAYGKKQMYGKEYLGTIRSTFVIDEAGSLTHVLYNAKAKGHLQLLRAELQI